jgi:hypothetical protein
VTEIGDWLSQKIILSLRSLLEGKHLYQSVIVDRDAIQAEAATKFSKSAQGGLGRAIDQALDANWFPHDEISIQRPGYGGADEATLPPRISFFLPAMKAACAECRDITPFNLKDVFDVYGKRDRRWAPIEADKGQQEFVFAFECQSCRTAPDVFLVRRRGLRLMLCGRSPMELALVPKFIPKVVQRYYSSAMVAFQSGQTLAALFLLRVLIEQFTRQAIETNEGLKADEVLDRYMDLLPGDFKNKFPSLTVIYGSLSAAIHAANESSEIFEISVRKIEKHFDARGVYEL